MLGKWFRKKVADKLANKVIPDAADAAEKPIRQTGETLEFAGKTVPDQDLESGRQIEQSGLGGPPQGTAEPPDPSPRRSWANVGGLVRGRDLLDDLDYAAAHRLLRDETRMGGDGIGDPALGEIYRQQGFDGPPTLADAAGVDAVIAAGGREFFRGVRDAGDVAAFKLGKYYPGRGIRLNGNGTFVTTSRAAALGYADRRPSQVIRMVLRPEANHTDIAALTRERRTVEASLGARLAELRKAPATPQSTAQYVALLEHMPVLKDIGRFAAVRGYDAYRVGEGLNNDEYWVVLNRTALVVER